MLAAVGRPAGFLAAFPPLVETAHRCVGDERRVTRGTVLHQDLRQLGEEASAEVDGIAPERMADDDGFAHQVTSPLPAR